VRILVVEPGPHFSVADVCNGWTKGFRQLGAQVVQYNHSDRLYWHEAALRALDPELLDKPDAAEAEWRAVKMVSKHLEAAAFEMWPDIVFVVSGFFVPLEVVALMRSRGMKVVLLATESPYEDDRQAVLARAYDAVILNDPTNLDLFKQNCDKATYIPHAYDPEIHKPAPALAGYESDFCFVGTGYQSRLDFLQQVDWRGWDVKLGGNWQLLDEADQLAKFVQHPLEECMDNAEAAKFYQSTRASMNLYRKEATQPHLVDGWAMGPREVELAACGTFFLREPRGEGDDVLPMLPTFSSPGEFTEQLDWWLTHEDERANAAASARAAISDRTFVNNARQFLTWLHT
jgi:spore maturation protein CgeB